MTPPFDPAAYDALVFDEASLDDDRVTLRYALRGDQPITFTETIDLPLGGGIGSTAQAWLDVLHALAGVSYHKAAMPGRLVDAGAVMTPTLGALIEAAYTEGLAECAHVNGLPAPELAIETNQYKDRWHGRPARALEQSPNQPKLLVPFGGGKDSLLTARLLSRAGFPCTLFIVGPNPVAEYAARATGLPMLTASRTIDPRLLELNARGAINGHVPITAIVSAIAMLVASMHTFDAVVMSNERSANRGTLLPKGRTINHQWSKSLHAERLIADHASTIPASPAYCSLLRPFSELAICRAVAEQGLLDRPFFSCNANFRRTRDPTEAPKWCGSCTKCLFVALCLAPWTTPDRLAALMGDEVLTDLERGSRREALGQLLSPDRPFDCVGDRDECHAACALIARCDAWRGSPLASFCEKHAGPDDDAIIRATLAPSEDHRIPSWMLVAVEPMLAASR